jgi:uncharacterized protein
MKVRGRLVLVTGASSGIGAATAVAMAREGGRVLLLARTRTALDEVAARIIAAGGEAWVYPVDLSDPAAVRRVSGMIKSEIGIPDILINNAGAGRFLAIEETDADEAVRMMTVPYFAAFFITRAFLPEMLRRNRGHVVNVTAPISYIPWQGATGYAVARWAMRGFSEVLRADLHGTAIRVTTMVPGFVDSPYLERNQGGGERIPRISKIFRTLTPEDVATAMVRGVERNRRTVIIPPLLAWVVWLHRLFPRPLEWLAIRTGWRRPWQEHEQEHEQHA